MWYVRCVCVLVCRRVRVSPASAVPARTVAHHLRKQYLTSSGTPWRLVEVGPGGAWRREDKKAEPNRAATDKSGGWQYAFAFARESEELLENLDNYENPAKNPANTDSQQVINV